MHYSATALHIPDGFLSLTVSGSFWAITIFFITLALRNTNKNLGEKQIPLMGMMAAFVFAAQMLNFPIPGGTSGHFLGGALAAIVLGPWAGILVMTAVIAVQGLLFQDGGLLVMGANIFNMGILTAIIGFGLVRAVDGKSPKIRFITAGFAAWASTVISAILAALQLWLSGTSSLAIVLPAMLSVHIIIGIGEAVITFAALGLIERTRPDLSDSNTSAANGSNAWAFAGIVVAVLAAVLSPFASQNPDGLDSVANKLGFIAHSQAAPYKLLPDYKIPFIDNQAISTSIAGLFGLAVVLAIVVLLSKALQKRETPARSTHTNMFDRFQNTNSTLHRLDPRVKVLTLILFVLCNVLLPDGAWLAFFFGWLVLLAANHWSKLGILYTFERSAIALPFAMVAISAIFSPAGTPLAEWHLLGLTLHPTDLGLLRFFSILLRSWLSVQMGILLVAVTPFPDLIHALEHLHFPKSLTSIIAFLYRYLFVLTDETYRLLRARDSRSAGIEGQKAGGTIAWQMKVAGNMAGQLFIRSYDRSDRIFNAMLARGYTGNIRTLHPHTIKKTDRQFFALLLLLLLIIQLTGWIR